MSPTEAGTSVFFNPQQRGLGAAVATDDEMHWDDAAALGEPTAVETQFLGFNVPDANINAFTYLWAHPNLGVVTGGAWAWQGIRPDALTSELFDMRDYLSDGAIREGGLSRLRLENSYRVDVIDPLERIRIRYDDAARGNHFDVTATAVMPPAMVASGKHFDQAMRTEGRLRLRGRDYVVNGFHVRDRSWGETRAETPRQVPPLYWTSPVFGDDFAVNVTGVDDPAADPVWAGLYDFDAEKAAALNRGWVWRDGELHDVVSSSVRTQWDRRSLYPVSQTIDVTDSAGRQFTMTSEVTAACNWHVYSNVRVAFCLARWTCDGRTGWGEIQAVTWTDFLYHLTTES
jgi:hypothetical protein